MVGDWLQGWFNICHQAEMHIHKYTKTSKLLPGFYSPGASLHGNLFRFIPHPDIQSRSNQTLILCTLLPIEPTIGEIISFDLLEEKRGEVDLSKQRFYSKPWLFRTLNGFSWPNKYLWHLKRAHLYWRWEQEFTQAHEHLLLCPKTTRARKKINLCSKA